MILSFSVADPGKAEGCGSYKSDRMDLYFLFPLTFHFAVDFV